LTLETTTNPVVDENDKENENEDHPKNTTSADLVPSVARAGRGRCRGR
jgi:hypothetical protein